MNGFDLIDLGREAASSSVYLAWAPDRVQSRVALQEAADQVEGFVSLGPWPDFLEAREAAKVAVVATRFGPAGILMDKIWELMDNNGWHSVCIIPRAQQRVAPRA